MARISDAAIRDIRDRVSLAEVVGDTVTLKRAGNSQKGLCPFHAEKTPSFTVSDERGFFHCFGCGEHGDVFTFVMKTEGLPFPDAVRRVAERFGLPVPEDLGPSRPAGEPLIAVSAAAAGFFRAQLRAPVGATALAYLRERGLADDTIERFGLGFAPGSGEALARHLRAQGLPVEDALSAGLVLQRHNGPGVFDRFRDRVIFPITDATSRVIAFGGRILPGAKPVGGEAPPKYLNSPETPIFHKGNTLYGLALARNAIRAKGRALVVEGYLDVISLAEAGIEEAVAPLGTALTGDQLRVLRRHTDIVVACFDGDTAGQRAAARSFPIFLEAGLWGRGVFLPAGEDPDTFVRTQGAAKLEDLIAHAAPLVDAYLVSVAGPRKDAVARRSEAARDVARLLKQVRSPYEFDVLVRLAAERLGVREDVLRADGAPGPADAPTPSPDGIRFGTPGGRVEARGAEELLIELMAAYPAAIDTVRAADVIEAFEDPGCRQAAEGLVAAADEAARDQIVLMLPRGVRDRVALRRLGDLDDDDRHQALADCIHRVQQRRQRRLHVRLREQVRAAEARGDIEAARAAMQRLRDLSEKSLR